MTRFINALFVICCLFITNSVKADSWIDPTWEGLLQHSDLVALVEYTSNGDFKASAKILKTYKGDLKAGEEIWVSGFSNRYGPVDQMHSGDRYLVFLDSMEISEKTLKYWDGELKDKPELGSFVESIRNGKVFYVSSPTSGDLQVRNNEIQYDLMQTSFYNEQPFSSMKRFEKFLEVYYDRSKLNSFSRELLSDLKSSSTTHENVQHLLMLYLLGYNEYQELFYGFLKDDNPSVRFALVQLVGNMNDEKSKEILLVLLDDKHSLVQGEVVRQLSKNPSNGIGAILLEKLKGANPYNAGPNNIMDPVMNKIDGGQTQIIKTLGKIGYKPAIPELLTMLETKDYYEFDLIVETLRELGTREYADYVSKHLRNLDSEMALHLCFIIRDDSLTDCIPALMDYVSRHDKTAWPTTECTISKYFGLARFPMDTVKQFLFSDFQKLMKMPNTDKESIDTKQKWVNEYMSSFTALGIDGAKEALYDFMYPYYGFNARLKKEPAFFGRKAEIEDSLVLKVAGAIKHMEPNVKIKALAVLNNSLQLEDYIVKYTIPRKDNGGREYVQRLDTLNALIFSQTTIDKKHLIWSNGNYTGGGGKVIFPSFSDSFMTTFLGYISTFADNDDVLFIENLLKYNYCDSEYQCTKLKNLLISARTNAGK